MKLILPKTLRLANENEVPTNSSVHNRLLKSKNANIVSGFSFQLKDDNPSNANLNFKFYAEINCNNTELWNLILALAYTLPNDCALIFGHIDDDINYGKYTNKEDLLEFISHFETELTHDTFINWGLLYHDEDKLIEIFVDESKYLKYWGIDETEFRKIMKNFNLNEIPKIEFIDEYPKVRENITRYFTDVKESSELIQTLQKQYI